MIRRIDYVALAVGVAAVSFAAVLIRGAEAPALVIAAYRMGIAGAIAGGAAGAVRLRRGAASEPPGRWWAPLAGGGFLALHFGFWIASVQQTSVVTSVMLVTTTPLFIAAASPWLLGESPGPALWAGIAVATVGGLVMAAEDIGAGGDTLLGDLYALLGSVFAAAYLMVGRLARPGGSWLAYVGSVYPVAGVLLIAAALIAGDSFTGYDAKTYAMFALLALGPQLVGHSALNWALGHLPAATVSMAVRGEPVGATLLAALILAEIPTGLQVAGALLVLAGVYVALRRRAVAAPATPAVDRVEPAG